LVLLLVLLLVGLLALLLLSRCTYTYLLIPVLHVPPFRRGSGVACVCVHACA